MFASEYLLSWPSSVKRRIHILSWSFSGGDDSGSSNVCPSFNCLVLVLLLWSLFLIMRFHVHHAIIWVELMVMFFRITDIWFSPRLTSVPLGTSEGLHEGCGCVDRW